MLRLSLIVTSNLELFFWGLWRFLGYISRLLCYNPREGASRATGLRYPAGRTAVSLLLQLLIDFRGEPAYGPTADAASAAAAAAVETAQGKWQ